MSSPSSTSAPHFTYRTVASESAHSSTVDAFPPPGPPPLYGNIPLSADIARRILEQNQEKQEVRDRERAMLLASPAIRPPREASSGSRESSTPSDDSAEAVNTDDSTQPTSEASGGGSRILVNGEPVYRDSMDSAATGSTDACLPEGLGVKEALAQCEDPTLGWSQQFWITIADPNTGHVFFACPATGRTSWTPPQGVFIVPRQADGEWWELADESRGNRSYYYNTLTRSTQWTRPGDNQFVIPLGLIQSTATLPHNPRRSRVYSTNSADHLRPNNPASPFIRSRGQSDPPGFTRHNHGPRPPPSPRRDATRTPDAPPAPRSGARNLVVPSTTSSVTPPSPPRGASIPSQVRRTSHSSPLTPPSPETPRQLPRILSVVGEGDGEEASDREAYADNEESGNEADQSVLSGGSGRTARVEARGMGTKFEGKKEQGRGFLGMLGRQGRSRTSPIMGEKERGGDTVPMPWMKRNGSSVSISLASPISWPQHHPNTSVPVLPRGGASAPIPVNPPTMARSKRMSTGLHPLLPSAVSAEIQKLQGNGVESASAYFATRRSGLLRHKLPLDKVLEWQKQPISAPLLNTSKGPAAKEALMCFKVVQRTMGERDRPVEGARVAVRSTTQVESAMSVSGGNGGGRGEKTVVLEEIKWMIQSCLAKPELKDEVYCQVIKQVTKNPNQESVVLGFQLLSVLANSFAPGTVFQPFVKSFLEGRLDSDHDGVAKMARYVLTKMAITLSRHGRGRALTIGEIEHASDAAFYPSVYGESLTKIMRDQSTSHPGEKIPVILPFLANAILQLRGLQAEGIFRIPGDGDVVAEMRSRMDRGHFQLAGMGDPHVAASLFKLWLRELEEPLIPSELYDEALSAAASTRPDQVIAFVQQLPARNRRVLLFVIAFFQIFCKDEVVAVTKMTPYNLALVLAPNILRTTSESLVVVFNNSGFESRFVLLLLQHLDVAGVDKGYAPRLSLQMMV